MGSEPGIMSTDIIPADSPHDPPAAAPRVEQPGPADVRDPLVKREAGKAFVWIGMAALFALAVVLIQPILVIIGALVFAAALDGGVRLLGKVLPIGRGWRLAMVCLSALAFLIWLVIFAGNQLIAQAAELPALLETQFNRMLAFGESMGFTADANDLKGLAGQVMGGIGQVSNAVSSVLGAMTTLFMIVVLGIFIAIEPRLYERGIAWMLPLEERAHFYGTMQKMGHALRRLLAGRMLGMVIEGFATWIMLAVYGVPMAALLGLLTGLLAALPNIGAILSGLIMILVGFSGGVEMGLFTIFVYFFVQIVDGNIIVPMVARKTVDLAPALVLGAQLIFGALFGILGLALADPIVAMLKIWLERHSEKQAGFDDPAG